MKKGVFISYSDLDKKKKESLKKRLAKSKYLFPIVIADRRQTMRNLADKVISGIQEADYLIPILTQNSFQNQWVNQEIGFAKSLELVNRIEIIPILEDKLLSGKMLKGFINDQLDLSYNYKSDPDPKKERRNFRKIYNLLIADLEKELFIGNESLVKFKGDRRLFLPVDGKLIQFPDIYTRKLFGFTYDNVIEYDVNKKNEFEFKGVLPSVRKVQLYNLNDIIYARFNNELKMIPDLETFNYISEINKNKPIKITDLEGDLYIGKALVEVNKIEK